MEEDIRWIHRLDNFTKALSNLTEAVDLSNERELSKLEKQGLIQAFEYTYELAWKTVKDFYQYMGETDIQGSKDAFRLAFQRNLIKCGQALMNSIKSRQLTSHTYNDKTANDIYSDILNEYYQAFIELHDSLEKEKSKSL